METYGALSVDIMRNLRKLSPEDMEWVVKAGLATMFAVGMGILAAFVWGYLMIRIIFEVLFGH